MAVKHSTESKPLTIPEQPPSPNSLKTRMLAALNAMSNNSGREHDPEKEDWYDDHDITEVDPERVRRLKEYFEKKDPKRAAKQQTTETPSIFE